MEIILFHAGDYKEKTNKDGFTVPVLTKRAEKLTARAAEGMDRLLPRKTKAEVWANLETHLSQSAVILAEELGLKSKFVNAIGHDNAQDLIKVIDEHAKDRCLIIVAEQPYLEMLAQHLAGVKLPFDRYCAAGFLVNPEDYSATLLWFTNPDSLSRLR